MWTPSKASGAVPMTTDSTSLISMPAESRAILPASKASSLPVSSILRLNFVIPAPIIATLLIFSRSRRQRQRCPRPRRVPPPRKGQGVLGPLHLVGTCSPPELKHALQRPVRPHRLYHVPCPQRPAAGVQRRPFSLDEPEGLRLRRPHRHQVLKQLIRVRVVDLKDVKRGQALLPGLLERGAEGFPRVPGDVRSAPLEPRGGRAPGDPVDVDRLPLVLLDPLLSRQDYYDAPLDVFGLVVPPEGCGDRFRSVDLFDAQLRSIARSP